VVIIVLSILSATLTNSPLVIRRKVKALWRQSSSALAGEFLNSTVLTLIPVVLTLFFAGLMIVLLLCDLSGTTDTVAFITDTIITIIGVFSFVSIGFVMYFLVIWFLWLWNRSKYYSQYIVRIFSQ
jgi:hypothetical protein